MNILEVQDLSYTYPDGTQALSHVDFTIKKGEKAVFLGANGAGKSTLFLHINGILKPTDGGIILNGEKLEYGRKALQEARRTVGIVFQDPDNQIVGSEVFGDVSFGPLNLGLSDNEAEERVCEALKAVGIYDLKDRPTRNLSYGQKKKVCIAGMLAMRPDLIILDEPTDSLDPKASAEMNEILNGLSQKGVTIILSTHDINFAYGFADRVFVMKNSEIIGAGSPEEVFLDKELLYKAEIPPPFIVEMYEFLKDGSWDKMPRTIEELKQMVKD